MNAKKLYNIINKDFDIENMKDDWSEIDLGDFITENFKEKYIGLVLDNTNEIKKVYTSVFPDEIVLDKILSTGEKNVLLFSHHAMIWDMNIKGPPFRNIKNEYLKKMKDNKISFYVLHVPLDKNGEYSTTVNLAKAIGIKKIAEFCEYFGIYVGIIGKTIHTNISKFAKEIEGVVKHKIKLWQYGEDEIKNKKVALVAGGGNEPYILEDLAKMGINTYITGVTKKTETYQPSIDFHNFAKKHKINIIGATHYSTEKFACISMLKYFEKQGFNAEFIEGHNPLNDMG